MTFGTIGFTILLCLLLKNVENRAISDRRLKAEGVTHLRYVIIPPNQTDANFPMATELLLESFHIDHWNENLFSNMNHTKYLSFLNGNIPKMTFRSSILESLSVIHANLSSFEVTADVNQVLKTLQLSRNKLTSLPYNVEFLVGLTTLDLSQNELEYVNLNWLNSMKGLQNLDLSVNRIVLVEATIDVKLGKLKRLWLGYNRLQQFEVFPRAFPALATIGLIGNRWSCRWVDQARKDIMQRGIVVFGVDFGCEESRQGGLCCYGAALRDSTTEASLLREGPLVENIQKLTNELIVNPLNTSREPTLELLTRSGGNSGDEILVGIKLNRVKVFF